MIQVMEHDLRICSYCPKSKSARKQNCGRCGEEGHNRNNMSCNLHPHSRTHCDFPQYEDKLSEPEKMRVEKYKDAFKAFFISGKKESILTLIENYL